MTSSFKHISSVELSTRRDIHVVDIRSYEERVGEFGFIPGSLSDPEGAALGDLFELLPDSEPVALACLGGTRAAACLVNQLEHGIERPLYNLEGGLLGWTAQGLPRAFFDPQDGDYPSPLVASSPQEFFTQMRACFVGEIVEMIVERDLDINPVELLNASSKRAHVYHNSSPIEERLIDFAGHASWQVGTSLEHIADNTSWALANRHLIAKTDLSKLSW